MAIQLEDLADFFGKSDEIQGYIDMEQGRIVITSEEFSPDEEFQELSEDQRMEQAMLEEDCSRCLPLPNVYDEYASEIRRKFADSITAEEGGTELKQSLQGHGSAANFKRCVRRLGLTADWEIFKDDFFYEVARDWCEENLVDFEV